MEKKPPIYYRNKKSHGEIYIWLGEHSETLKCKKIRGINNGVAWDFSVISGITSPERLEEFDPNTDLTSLLQTNAALRERVKELEGGIGNVIGICQENIGHTSAGDMFAGEIMDALASPPQKEAEQETEKNICDKCLEHLHEYREWKAKPGQNPPEYKTCNSCIYNGSGHLK